MYRASTVAVRGGLVKAPTAVVELLRKGEVTLWTVEAVALRVAPERGGNSW